MVLKALRERSAWPKPAGLISPNQIVADFLSELEGEIHERLRAIGPLRGRVTEQQRPWSRALDLVASEKG